MERQQYDMSDLGEVIQDVTRDTAVTRANERAPGCHVSLVTGFILSLLSVLVAIGVGLIVHFAERDVCNRDVMCTFPDDVIVELLKQIKDGRTATTMAQTTPPTLPSSSSTLAPTVAPTLSPTTPSPASVPRNHSTGTPFSTSPPVITSTSATTVLTSESQTSTSAVGTTTTTSTAATATTAVAETEVTPPPATAVTTECRDIRDDCADYGEEAGLAYADFRERLCRRFCGMCGAGREGQ